MRIRRNSGCLAEQKNSSADEGKVSPAAGVSIIFFVWSRSGRGWRRSRGWRKFGSCVGDGGCWTGSWRRLFLIVPTRLSSRRRCCHTLTVQVRHSDFGNVRGILQFEMKHKTDGCCGKKNDKDDG